MTDEEWVGSLPTLYDTPVGDHLSRARHAAARAVTALGWAETEQTAAWLNSAEFHLRQAVELLEAEAKPPEPTGLGAVLEDTDGHLWMRVEGVHDYPWYPVGEVSGAFKTCVAYNTIDVKRILSQGYTP